MGHGAAVLALGRSPLQVRLLGDVRVGLGVKFSLVAGSNAAATWLTAFEAVWAESTSVEDAAERAPRGQRSKPTSSSTQQKPAVGS